MKRVLFLFLAFLAAVSQSYAFIDSYTIDRDKLPDAAKEMLDEYFPKAKVSMIKVDRHQRHHYRIQQQGKMEIGRLQETCSARRSGHEADTQLRE